FAQTIFEFSVVAPSESIVYFPITIHLLFHKRIKDIFFAFSQGVYETTIILSDSEHHDVDILFKNEKIIQESIGLSSLTIKLPSENSDVSGIYYFILKKLAWEGINILDIISTMHEFTIIVNDENIDRAFSILKNINKSI
ncbi:MAG: hypothetical protein CVT95_06995, partial [Bacteroidetes bacterium HGW-Bacteroidetes-12]